MKTLKECPCCTLDKCPFCDAPRTITREELAIAAKSVCDADEKSNGEAPFSELAKAALATLGITVGDL